MSHHLDPTSAEFFERKYSENSDPWNFASDPYECSRYDALIGALSGRRFARAFEPGCSVGVLTERLAPICDELLSTDISETAVCRARVRCGVYPNVHFELGSVADANPGPLDLLILSEVGYYFPAPLLRSWSDRLLSCLRPGATFLTCHWLGVSSDHLITGEVVQEILGDLARERSFTMALEQRTENYNVTCWNR